MQFITWNDRKLYEYVDKIDQSQQTSGTTRATDEGTSRISTELPQEQWTLLQERRERPSAPYDNQGTGRVIRSIRAIMDLSP